jgi:purine-nucleoside phosphorylase
MRDLDGLPAPVIAAVAAVRRAVSGDASIALILGSGLGAGLEGAPVHGRIAFPDIPGLPPPTVAGHRGELRLVEIDGIGVWVMAGRVHAYEGHDPEAVLLPARLVAALGARVLIATNAVGGIREDLEPGGLAVITDHLNLMGRNPLATAGARQYGEVFLPLNDLYDRGVREALHTAGGEAGVPLAEVVYAAFSGPTYETPAEVRMARALGGDVVGMALVPEALAARQLGVKVGAVACIANKAAGLVPTPPSHAEVLAAGERAAAALGAVLRRAVRILGTNEP